MEHLTTVCTLTCKCQWCKPNAQCTCKCLIILSRLTFVKYRDEVVFDNLGLTLVTIDYCVMTYVSSKTGSRLFLTTWVFLLPLLDLSGRRYILTQGSARLSLSHGRRFLQTGHMVSVTIVHIQSDHTNNHSDLSFTTLNPVFL